MGEYVRYSVITPAFNEEEMLPRFLERVVPVMESLGSPFEIIVVNDGSKDKTAEILAASCEKDKRVKGINLSRNFGQQAALLAGLGACRGDAAILMDIDLQDPPDIIPEMVRMYAEEGYDIVHARRSARPKDSFLKKLTAKLFYRFIGRISNPPVPDNVSDFKIYSRRAIDEILALPERIRFLKSQSVWIGFKQGFVDFVRPEREAGKTKYTPKKMFRLAADAIVSNSNYPLSLSLKFGVFACFTALLGFVGLGIAAGVGAYIPFAAWLFPFAALLLGIDLCFKGVSDMYLSRIYEEVKNRPVYIIKDKLGFDDDEKPDGKNGL